MKHSRVVSAFRVVDASLKIVAEHLNIERIWVVARYSILKLNSAGEVTGSCTYNADSDEAALMAARAWLATCSAVEVWKGMARVAIMTTTKPRTF